MRSLVPWLALGIVGCARPVAPPVAAPPGPAAPPRERPEPLPPVTSEVPEPTPGPCAEGGRLWDGKPVDCSYEHGGCCYGSAPAACAAAGCPAERCLVLESYPAQISCDG
jgi:hypothetical protein